MKIRAAGPPNGTEADPRLSSRIAGLLPRRLARRTRKSAFAWMVGALPTLLPTRFRRSHDGGRVTRSHDRGTSRRRLGRKGEARDGDPNRRPFPHAWRNTCLTVAITKQYRPRPR